jgi:signal transduction histidine kinase
MVILSHEKCTLCRELIEKCGGGALNVESVEGKGSTFSFLLPESE